MPFSSSLKSYFPRNSILHILVFNNSTQTVWILCPVPLHYRLDSPWSCRTASVMSSHKETHLAAHLPSPWPEVGLGALLPSDSAPVSRGQQAGICWDYWDLHTLTTKPAPGGSRTLAQGQTATKHTSQGRLPGRAGSWKFNKQRRVEWSLRWKDDAANLKGV